MSTIQNILIATDFSERSAWAEKRAAIMCAQYQCRNTELMTVKEAELPETLAPIMNSTVDAAKSLIADAAQRELRTRLVGLSDSFGGDYAGTVRFGQPAKEIVARGDEIAADLIVVGAHGGNFFTDLFLGNTADRLIHLCRRPLLIVKNEPQSAYLRILVPVDFSEDSKQAAHLALRMAPEASVTFLHAYKVWLEGKMHYPNVTQTAIAHYRVEAREQARLTLNDFINCLNAPHRSLSSDIVFGKPGPSVRDYAKKMQADLIVIGKHGHSGMEETIIGSVTRDMVEQTKCDILIVPPVPSSAQRTDTG